MSGRAGLGLGLLGCLGALWFSACSKSDDAGGYCAVYEQRQRDCGVIGEGATNCVNYLDAAESCETRCVAAASCDEIADFTCGTVEPYPDELDRCMGRCVGLEPVTCEDGHLLGGYARCDGLAECDPSGLADDSDEQGCDMPSYRCRNVDSSIAREKVCDGHQDCPDGSDELPDCAGVASCTSPDGTEIAVTLRMVCDGYAQCADDSDEADCAPHMCGG